MTAEVLAVQPGATDKGWDIAAHAANFYEQYLERLRPPLAVACAERCDFVKAWERGESSFQSADDANLRRAAPELDVR